MTDSRSRSEDNEPLMYIVQPTQAQTTRSMQYFYSSKQNEKEQQPLKEEPTFSPIQDVKSQEVKPEKAGLPANVHKHKEQKKPNKAFQYMNISEKINFLCGFPKHMAQPICEISVEGKSFIGTIVEFADGEVSILVPPHDKPNRVPVKDIITISIVKI
ncbi:MULTISPECIES: CotO family spore coat protein [Bacillaceae]|uniref:CotO family spore coat protein n=1 Tax=Bacillaceae TaxID=186817 RepID=UPI0010491A16|nr:CotO family spore coat protein [Bacillus sp. CBEL-1]TDB53189.1 hypothetical protein EPL02_06735 [Bacillus sp. CBEL-1]